MRQLFYIGQRWCGKCGVPAIVPDDVKTYYHTCGMKLRMSPRWHSNKAKYKKVKRY